MPRVVPSQVVALIEQTFPNVKNDPRMNVYSGNAAALSAIVKLSQQIPPELISISGGDYSDFIHGMAAIENVVTKWHLQGGNEPMNEIRKKSPVFILREMLGKCPDEYPSTTTAGLTFIADSFLRESIRMDLSVATSALHHGEWKASTVLASAVVEALLLWKIQQNLQLVPSSATAKKPLEEWGLAALIKFAKDSNLIEQDTATAAFLAKDYRNLIHPGVAQRASQVCNIATAYTALGAAERAIVDLSKP